MEIIFLGTTAAVPSATRGHSSIALKYEGEVILWDCGEGTQRQLIRTKTSYMKISKIFITHFHGDHFLGLPGLIQTLSFSDRRDPLHIYGPKGIGDLVRAALSLGVYDLNFKIYTHEINNGFVVEEEKYYIKCFKVRHSIPTYGLLFEEKKGREFLVEKAKALGLKPGPAYSKLQRGEEVTVDGRVIKPEEVLGEKKKGIKIVYSSDTRPCRSVIENAEDALLIHDGTFDGEKKENARETEHSTCVEAAEVAKEGKALALYLTHISPRYKTDELLEKQAQQVFENSKVARDLLKIQLTTKFFQRPHPNLLL
jgi:ribonuclease Z